MARLRYDDRNRVFDNPLLENLAKRLEFVWQPTKAPSKDLAVWCNSATDLNNIAAGFDPWFRALDDATSANVMTNLGYKMATGSSANDDSILTAIRQATAPFLTNVTASTGIPLSPDVAAYKKVRYGWAFRTPAAASMASMVLSVGCQSTVTSELPDSNDEDGFMLTNAVLATPIVAVGDTLRLVTVKDGTQTAVNTGIKLTANTTYWVEFELDCASLQITVYINGQKVAVSAVNCIRLLDDSSASVVFAPTVWIEALDAAAKSLYIRGFRWIGDWIA